MMMMGAGDALPGALGCLALSTVVAGTFILVAQRRSQQKHGPVASWLKSRPAMRKARTRLLPSPISALPADVLALCYQFLDGRSVLRCAAVSLNWHAVAQGDRFWRHRYGVEFGELPTEWWQSPTVPAEVVPCSWRTLYCRRGVCRLKLREALTGLDLGARQYTRWAARIPMAALECVLLAIFEFAYNGLHGPAVDGYNSEEHHGFTARQLAALNVLREAHSVGLANGWNYGEFKIAFSAILAGAYTPEDVPPPPVAGPSAAVVLHCLGVFVQERLTPSTLELLLWNIGGWGSRGSPSLAWNGSPTPRPYLERIALKFQALNDIARGKPTH